MSRIALHLSSRRVFDQQILVPQWSASDAEPSGRHVPVGKTVSSEDKPIGSHTLSGLLCQKQDTGLRVRGVRQATPMSSRLKPLAEQKEKPPRGLHYGYKRKLQRERERGGPARPAMMLRMATDVRESLTSLRLRAWLKTTQRDGIPQCGLCSFLRSLIPGPLKCQTSLQCA